MIWVIEHRRHGRWEPEEIANLSLNSAQSRLDGLASSSGYDRSTMRIAEYTRTPHPIAVTAHEHLVEAMHSAHVEAGRVRVQRGALAEALVALVDHVRSAGPTGWAAACDLAGAADWERSAEPLLKAADEALAPEPLGPAE